MHTPETKSFRFASAVALVVSVSSAMEFKADGAVLRLSETNGAVESLVAADGAERVMPAVEAFTLQG